MELNVIAVVESIRRGKDGLEGDFCQPTDTLELVTQDLGFRD